MIITGASQKRINNPSRTSQSPLSASSSRSSREKEESQHPWWMLYLYMILLLIIIVAVFVYMIMVRKKRRSRTGYNDPRIVARLKTLHNVWTTLSGDPELLFLARRLMDKNSDAANMDAGSQDIYIAYKALDEYYKQIKLTPRCRLTLIYLDGIVFYDSDLGISKTYFMKDGLPRPVNISTLGSPLKDHNVMPEMLNALSVYTPSKNYHYMGDPITDPFLHELIKDGFGFVERVSSSINVPCSYLANTIEYKRDMDSGYVSNLTMRVSMPI